MPIEPHDDGLIIPEVGPWARRKYHFLSRYLDAFTTAMRRKKWSGLYYIDLFAGAGFVRIRGTTEIIAGSPIVAANVKNQFSRLLLCDQSPEKAHALRSRLADAQQPETPLILCQDANEAVTSVIQSIPDRSLSVAFVDPYGLHFEFNSVKALSQRRIDLIVLLPDAMDVLRNWGQYYDTNPESNLDRFMPPETDWRRVLRDSSMDKCKIIREMYQAGLKNLGYSWFEHERISNTKGAGLYILLYASASEIGAGIWRRTSRKEEGGQMRFG